MDIKTTLSKQQDDIWITDSGTSSHMKHSMKGMFHLKDITSYVTFGDSRKLITTKLGDQVRMEIEENISMKIITINHVKYVPMMFCTILSLTASIEQGYTLSGNNKSFQINKGNYKFRLIRRLKVE